MGIDRYYPRVPTLRDILIYVSEFLGFWLEVFRRSAADLLRIVFHSPIPVLVFLGLLSGIGLLAKYRVAGPDAVKEKLTYVFVPWLIAVFLIFTYFLIVTPFKIYNEQSNRETAWHRRSDYFVSKVPAQLISSDEREKIKAIIEPLAGTAVVIQFDLDDPYRRAETFANSLAEVFRSAGWQVTLTGQTENRFAVKQGVTLRIPGNAPIGKTQNAVIEVFKLFPEYPKSTLVTGPGTIGDTVELFIGEL